MYSPAAFAVTDPGMIREIIREHPFATLVTGEGTPSATHIPVIADPDSPNQPRLLAHFAKANPHWRQLLEVPEVLVIFQGPHAYVSPQWYREHPAVPTWNYIAVHAWCRARLVEDPERLLRLVTLMTTAFEGPGEEPMPAEYRDRMLAGIVGLELEVRRFEAKFKLSQNRSAADVSGVIAALEKSSDSTECATARWMRRIADAAIASATVQAKTSAIL